MPISPEAAALAILCRANGVVAEIIYDELGLRTANNFLSVVHSSNVRKARRFLRTVIASHAALDWELNITADHGIIPLFFSAAMTTRGIVIIGMKHPVASVRMPNGLLQAAVVNPETLAPSLQEIGVRKQAKTRARRRLRSELSRFKELMASRQETTGRAKSDRAAQIHLLRTLAHDLRNPISGILAASQYLIEDASSSLDSQQLTLLRSIESSSGLMLRFIENLLELWAAGFGRPALHLKSTDITRLVDHSVAIHRPLAQARNTQLKVKRDEVVPHLYLDPLKMTHAINAVLTNAVRSSTSGSDIELTIAARPESVVITVRSVGPAEPVEHPKADTGSARRRARETTALTLTAVRRIVEAQGGSVRVQNPVGRPAFTLTIPRAGRESAKSRQAREYRPTKRQKPSENS
jgi:K+-sensing histidine kinase KdpD